MEFTQLGILPELELALSKNDITIPTAIQKNSFTPILEGKDVFINAETGSGKTLAYLLPLLSQLNINSKALQIIIIAPTHELCSQIHDQILQLRQHSTLEFRSQLLIGSAATKRQIEKLKKKPHIVVGTTGRMLELVKLKKLKVHTVNSVVIDEADKMLFDDSLVSLKELLRTMLRGRQMIYASATTQTESDEAINSLSPNVITVEARGNQMVSNIEHIIFTAHENNKTRLLRKLINACAPEHAIVFTHKNETAKRVAKKLREHSITVSELHGDCDKEERVKSIRDFRVGKTQIMVASDMAARGLDFRAVSHIFNIDAPTKSKDYIHRAGRTGRAGNNGYCISLMSGEEQKIARRYERELGIEMKQARLLDGEISFDV